MANKKNLLLLFEKPGEPVFTPKGKNNAIFVVPEEFIEKRLQPYSNKIQIESVGEKFVVQDVVIPDLSVASSLKKNENLSLFIPKHREATNALMDIFIKAKDINQLQSYACYARDRVNPLVFNYALSVAILHRKDTKDLNLPLFAECFPSKFMDSDVFVKARQEVSIFPPGFRRSIEIGIDYTATPLEPEHPLWYFREDLGVNLHHWHWHLVYPFDASDRNIVAKDRRGELFYYMHQQIIARYNFERFSNNLKRVVPLNNLHESLPEGYFPKLDFLVASRNYPARTSNAVLKCLNRKESTLKISDMELWHSRILQAIAQGFAVNDCGERILLDAEKGIDILGNMIEASILSPFKKFYGDLHNRGHVLISFQHDPDGRFLESFGVMGDTPTAMRDPLFYRWHSFIDNCFEEHKKMLTPYTEQELTYSGIRIQAIQVQPLNGNANVLTTHLEQSDVDLSKGMDFVERGDVFARFTHLQHDPYTMKIQVNNDSSLTRYGMVRVFMVPKTDERGAPWAYNEQRRMMIEMDKFKAQINPGLNTIERKSTESTLTIPFNRTFTHTGGEEEPGFNFCGCGWPHHMLVPRGTIQGLQCELFVMISDYELDSVKQDLVGTCNDASIYCGLRDRLYPDRRAMGYPFDRLGRQGVNNLQRFMVPNMGKVDIKIQFDDPPNKIDPVATSNRVNLQRTCKSQ